MSTQETPVDFSLVIPIYNEEEVIPFLKPELENFLSSLNKTFEVIFVNDGSTDASRKMLEIWALQSKKIRLIHLDQNAGHQKSLIRGIQSANGQWILTMDADLQDPFDVLPVMFLKSREGFDVVHAQRIDREGESCLRKSLTWFFYRFARMFFQKSLLLDVGDFRLMSRHAVQTYFDQFQNPRVLRKEIPNLALKQAVVAYRRRPRVGGKSKFTLYKLVELGLSILKK